MNNKGTAQQALSNFVDQFQSSIKQNTPPPPYMNKPESVAEQVSRLPNSEKLSPVEKWVYQKLPGISQSRVGQALSAFADSPAGKILGKLDVLAEGLERSLGVLAQYRDRNPEEEFKLKDAWTAGSLFYDVVKLPRVQYGPDGQITGVRIDSDAPGAYALTEARHLLEQGKTLEEVRDSLYGNMGALALRAQLNDTLGHIALDPATYLLGWLKPIERLHAARNLALTGKLAPELADAAIAEAKAAGRLDDVAKITEAMTKAQQEGKALTRFDRFAIALTGGKPWSQDVTKLSTGGQWWTKLNPLALTPQARASELLDMLSANVSEHLIRPNWFNDPEAFYKSLQGAARGSIGNEWGHLAGSIEGKTVQGILSNSDAAVKPLITEWRTYEAERTLLEKVASVIPGTDPYKLWAEARKSPEALFKKILLASEQQGGEVLKADMQAGKLTQKVLEDIGQISDKVPWSLEHFYAKAMVTIQDVAMQQSILQFGIKEKGMLTKWTDFLKAAESLPFIKANPANMVRNVVNNDVTLIGRGLFGTMSGNAIDKFWEGKWVPPQFMRAFGFAGEGEFDAGVATQRLMDTLEGKNLSLPQKLKMKVQGIDLGIADFSKQSQKWEARASKRASTMGWIEFHQRYWNPRTGFTSVSKYLDANTLDQMERAMPGISDILDDVAQTSGGDAAKFAELMQSNIEYNTTSVLKNVSDRLGYKLEDALGTEVLQRVHEGLPDAIQKGQVKTFIDTLRLDMEKHVDDMFTKHIENLPGIVAAQVQAGGPLQFHRLFGKSMDEFWGGNVEHAIRMSTINDALDYAKSTGDYRKVNQLWRRIAEDGESHFNRVWKKFDAYQAGMKEGAAKAGIPYPAEVENSFQEMQKGWKEFFDFRNSETQKFFDTIEGGGVPKKQFEEITAQVNKMYEDMVGKEDKFFQQIDDSMTNALTDKQQRQLFMNYRDRAAQLRKLDRQKTTDFFKKVRSANADTAPDMWQEYWNERMSILEQMRQLDARGSAALQGDAASAQMFFSAQPAGEPQNIFELASRYGVSSATQKGARNERRVLSTVNKYAEKAGVTDVQIVQNATLPDDVKSAYAAMVQARDLAKTAGKDIEDLAARQAAKDAAKQGLKDAIQGYNDALKTNNIDAGMIDKLVKNKEFMNVESIPMDVAKKALEARATEQAGQATKSIQQSFIPDAEKIFPDPQPIETALSEMNYGRSYAALDAIIEEATATAQKKSRLLSDLPEDLQKKVMNWAENVNGESNSFRAAGVQYAAFRRDSALLNYNRRTNFDNWVGHAAPFAFWTTHSIANWAVYSLDRPAMLTSYLRSRQFFETAGLKDQNVPSRLKGNIRVNMPFTPEWMGDTFVNPSRFLLPFDGFLQPWEQAVSGRFQADQKTQDTLSQMLEQGVITEDQFNEAVQNKSGDAWDAAYQQVQEGGDNYDAMDFVSMTMTPHAPLMWAYNAARGTPNEIGPFTPMSRTTRNIATMLGVKDWSNSPYNVEGRIRKELGLPAYDRWDDYRISRSISNMAAEGKYSMEDINQAMQVAALVEAGKMKPEDAKKQSKIYEEAIYRANQEFAGGAAGTLFSAIGVPLRAYPEGEQRQRELADQFHKAYDSYDKGNVQALTDFFDEHPEYEARLALFKSPEERLKNFMVDNIWSKWNEMPKVNQDELKDQLGDNFSTNFIDKNTRNYDNLSPLQLQVYLKLMGGKPVGTLTADQEVLLELNQLKFTQPETAWRVQTFYDMRKEDYPNWYTLQNKYYGLKEGKERSQFLKQNPQLKEYWDSRRKWMQNNPDLVRFLTDNEKELAKYAKMKRQPQKAVPTTQELQSQVSPEMSALLQDWQSGQNLPSSADRYLSDLAGKYGLTQRELVGILTGQ